MGKEGGSDHCSGENPEAVVPISDESEVRRVRGPWWWNCGNAACRLGKRDEGEMGG